MNALIKDHVSGHRLFFWAISGLFSKPEGRTWLKKKVLFLLQKQAFACTAMDESLPVMFWTICWQFPSTLHKAVCFCCFFLPATIITANTQSLHDRMRRHVRTVCGQSSKLTSYWTWFLSALFRIDVNDVETKDQVQIDWLVYCVL